MPANKYALLRYRIIDRCLTNTARPFPSKEDMRLACETALYGSDGEQISESTIEKDLWAMRNEGELGYYAPIAYSKAHRGYFYEDPDYTINNINLNDEDLSALNFAAETLIQFKNIPLFRRYHSAIDKVVSRLRINPDPNDQSSDAFIQFEEAPEVKGLEYLEPLVDAIRQRKQVTVGYRKFTDAQDSIHTLDPYLLKEYRNRWYLIAWHADKRDHRTYALDRIRSLERKEKSFKVATNFDPDRFFRYSIGITEFNSKPVEVVLHCRQILGQYLESQPLHKSQHLKWRSDGSAEVSLVVLITYELINEILGYGQAMEVLEPELLRTHIAAELKATLARYDSANS